MKAHEKTQPRRSYHKINNQKKLKLLNLFFYENYSMKSVLFALLLFHPTVLGFKNGRHQLFNSKDHSPQIPQAADAEESSQNPSEERNGDRRPVAQQSGGTAPHAADAATTAGHQAVHHHWG